MRRPLAIVVATVLTGMLLWGGWWWLGASLRQRALADWLAGRRADGWTAEAAAIRPGGFPYRVDIFVRDLALADPEAGWSWSAEGFEILSLAWRPQELILAWPGRQVIGTPLDRIELSGDVLRASARFEPNTRLALARSTLEAKAVTLHGDTGWTAGIDHAIVATRPAATGTRFAHDLSIEAGGLSLPDLIEANVTGGALPRTIDSVSVDATIGFDRPWDRPAVEAGGALLQAIDIRHATLAWGDLRLEAEGRLVADRDGRAEGRLHLKARNWTKMLEIAEQSGALEPGAAAAARAGLGLMSAFGGSRDTLDVSLDLGEGRMRIGPVPLGAAPRLAPPSR